MKYISLVLARSNSIVFSEASSYSLAASLSRIQMFFLRVVEEVVRTISSMYKSTRTNEARPGNKPLI